MAADDFENQLIKIDTQSSVEQTGYEPDCYPGEPVFVAEPQAQAEDAGVILAVVADIHRACSFFLILYVQTFLELARLPLLHVILFGFHRQIFPA